MYNKFIIQMREILNFGKKWYVLEEILGLISGSLPEDQGKFTSMTPAGLEPG